MRQGKERTTIEGRATATHARLAKLLGPQQPTLAGAAGWFAGPDCAALQRVEAIHARLAKLLG